MKPFTWSWSRLKNFRACPKKHYHVDLAKEFKEPENEHLRWGNEVHDALAKRLSKKTPLPEGMKQFENWPAKLEARGYKTLVEQGLAMSKDFTATGPFDDDTWFRAKVDALQITPAGTMAVSYDWKTGAVKPEMEQLWLSAQVVFAHYPEVQIVGTEFVWLGNDSHTARVYERDKMVPLWNELWPDINLMVEAHRTMTYPPKPSGLCKRHCPVNSCPHHGRGSF